MPDTAAERSRRRRALRRAGLRRVPILVDPDTVGALVDAKRLPEWSDENGAAIGAAIEMLLQDYRDAVEISAGRDPVPAPARVTRDASPRPNQLVRATYWSRKPGEPV
jgi:hypothetical protein